MNIDMNMAIDMKDQGKMDIVTSNIDMQLGDQNQSMETTQYIVKEDSDLEKLINSPTANFSLTILNSNYYSIKRSSVWMTFYFISYYSVTALKASSKSCRISSIFSVPIDKRIVFGLIPEFKSSSSVICEWVVDAGWITSDLTSATLASNENSSN